MDFSKIKTWTIGGKEVKTLEVNGQVYWKKEEVPPVECKAFYVEDASGSDNSLTLKKTGYEPAIKLEYSTNGSTWQEWVNCQTTALPISPNSKVFLRGKNYSFATQYNKYNTFNCSGNYNIGGDITTMLDPEGNVLDLTDKYFCFQFLFENSTTLQNTKDLILPSTTLANRCYEGMFRGCTSLVTAPKVLPAMTLTFNCYNSMFKGCTSLQTTPELPATTLAGNCYEFMFEGCTALQTAPELPATTLASGCYYWMFDGCTSLVTAPALPAKWMRTECYYGMFTGCTSLVNAPVLPATTLAKSCYSYMFSGCRKLNRIEVGAKSWIGDYATNWVEGVSPTGTFTKPKGVDIPIGTSGIPSGWTIVETVDYFYVEDASGSDNSLSLTKIGSDSPDIKLEYSTDKKQWQEWVNCQTTALPIEPNGRIYLRGTNYSIGSSNYGNDDNKFDCTKNYNVGGDLTTLLEPEGNVIDLSGRYSCFECLFENSKTLLNSKDLILPSTTLIDACYSKMFMGCTSLVTAPKLPATTIIKWCYYKMFEGCTSLVTAPELPATTLLLRCYERMFYGCTKLNSIKVGATNWDIINYTNNWLEGVSATGTFTKPKGTNIPIGTSGIPEGWTVVDV